MQMIISALAIITLAAGLTLTFIKSTQHAARLLLAVGFGIAAYGAYLDGSTMSVIGASLLALLNAVAFVMSGRKRKRTKPTTD